MNVEVVQRRLWEQSQQHRKHRESEWTATVCDRVLKRSNNQGSLESRMVGNLQVRFGVGAGVQFPGPHHASSTLRTLKEVVKTAALKLVPTHA